MRLVIFGATGWTGRRLVARALDDGHWVRAFVRDSGKAEEVGLPTRDKNLSLFEGDVRDAPAVRDAVGDRDAVLSALGPTDGDDDLLTVAARHIVDAMEGGEVSRLVSLIGAGVSMPDDPTSLGRTIMRGALRLFGRSLLEDAEEHARIIRSSDLKWTLVRPPRMTTGPATENYQSGYLAPGPTASISRADVAAFMVEVLDEGRYIREAPMVVSV